MSLAALAVTGYGHVSKGFLVSTISIVMIMSEENIKFEKSK